MRPIIGFEGKYSVDRQGNIYSHLRNITLKPRIRKDGYANVGLRKNGKTYEYTVHRLVVNAYFGNIKGKDVNHINSIRHDNSLHNLELTTRSRNLLHGMYVNRNGNAKLSYAQAEQIKKRVLNGEMQTEIAKEYSVLKQTINQIVRGVGYVKSNIVLEYPKRLNTSD